MSSILYSGFVVLVLLTALQLVFPFLTTLFSRLFGAKATRNIPPVTPGIDFGCIITAYRNAHIAVPLIRSLLLQDYQKMHIYLVADECDGDQVGIRDNRLTVLYPDPALRLKAKSIMYAMDNYVRPHDYTAVFDADNLAHPSFLSEMSRYVAAGYRCIQGQRTAKNLGSTYAALDSLGEFYKNYVERLGPFLLGGSAVISGSGMATETGLYRAYLNSPEIQQGKAQWKRMLQEDKILQNFLLRRNERIAYALEAVCFDEKVDSGEAVQTQRSRWLFSYFQNVSNALGLLRRGLFGLNANQFFFGVVTLLLPMFIQLALALFLALLSLWIAPVWALVLGVAMGIFALNVLWTLKLSGAPPNVWRAVWFAPKFVWRQVLGLFKMGNPNKNFKHTEHRHVVQLEDVMNQTAHSEKQHNG
jgi:cellulose synthase/poly-beta-1,6-N-acetylglucosamine synthase-like glycosyltransferase